MEARRDQRCKDFSRQQDRGGSSGMKNLNTSLRHRLHKLRGPEGVGVSTPGTGDGQTEKEEWDELACESKVHTLGASLLRLEKALLGTRVCRYRSVMVALRRESLDRPPSEAQEPKAVGGARPYAVLPAHLPVAPRGLFDVSRRPAGRRRQARRAHWQWAWRQAEWQLALYNGFALGSPASSSRFANKLGPYRVDGFSERTFRGLVEDNHRFSRLGASGVTQAPGRGLNTLRGLLQAFEASQLKNTMATNQFKPETLVAGALRVDPERLAVPDLAGRVDPASLLPPDKARAFLDIGSRLRDDGPMEAPRGFYAVSRKDEDALRLKLLSTGMAVLIEDRLVPRDRSGRALLNGLFCVAHKDAVDRMIFDRRPCNSQEHSLRWTSLPLGPMLTQMILGPSDIARGSGDDLRTYYYHLHNAPDSLSRNAFGRVVKGGGKWKPFGAQRGTKYRMALKVLAMGDKNGVDIADETHKSLLVQHGCMNVDNRLVYGQCFPSSKTLEALYIDDHVSIGIVPRSQKGAVSGDDYKLIQQSHVAYRSCGLPKADEKGFGFSRPPDPKGRPSPADTKFIALGTEVNGETGVVETPVAKRAQLYLYVSLLLSSPVIEKRLLQRTVACFIHPMMHRRPLLSVFHKTFAWLASLQDHDVVPWNPSVRAELSHACLVLPMAFANIRTEVSDRFVTTDATLSTGAATAGYASQHLADRLFHMAEHRGCHVTLRHGPLDADVLVPELPTIEELVKCMPWRTSRIKACDSVRHINLQEINETLNEVKAACARTRVPERIPCGTDSLVGLGAWGKGRSGSGAVNRLLQAAHAWQIFCQKILVPYRLSTSVNPSDDGTRGREIRDPETPAEWMNELLTPRPPSAMTTFAAQLAGESPVPGPAPVGVAPRGTFAFSLTRVCFGEAVSGVASMVCRAVLALGLSLAPSLCNIRPLVRRRPLGGDFCRGEDVRALESEIESGYYTHLVLLWLRGEPLAKWHLLVASACAQQRAGQAWSLFLPCTFENLSLVRDAFGVDSFRLAVPFGSDRGPREKEKVKVGRRNGVHPGSSIVEESRLHGGGGLPGGSDSSVADYYVQPGYYSLGEVYVCKVGLANEDCQEGSSRHRSLAISASNWLTRLCVTNFKWDHSCIIAEDLKDNLHSATPCLWPWADRLAAVGFFHS